MENNSKSVFENLNSVDCSAHTEAKNGLTYLSWAWAWAEVKKRYPQATYTIYENAAGMCYHNDGRTAWVKTGVTIEGLEHIEYLPIMDNRNRSIMIDNITSFDVNKAIQRSLTKACARHGLGLYIYAGEDLPEGSTEAPVEQPKCINTAIVTGDVYAKLERVMTLQELKSLYDEYPQFQKNADFIAAFSYRKKEIQEGKI